MDLQAFKTVFGSDFCYKLTLTSGRTYICLQLLQKRKVSSTFLAGV